MQIKGIYIFLLLGFIQLAAIFVASPYMMSQKIARIVMSNDTQAWEAEIDQEYFQKYSRTLLDGLLRAKMAVDQQHIGIREAMQDYQFAKKTSLVKEGRRLSSTQGIARIL
jgi:hypothetical protein